jgi:hypothetical protein
MPYEFFPASPTAVASDDILRETVQKITGTRPTGEYSDPAKLLETFDPQVEPEYVQVVRSAIADLYFTVPTSSSTKRKTRQVGILPLNLEIVQRFRANSERRLDRFVAMLAFGHINELRDLFLTLLTTGPGLPASVDPLVLGFVSHLIEKSTAPEAIGVDVPARPWCFVYSSYFIRDFRAVATAKGITRRDRLALLADLISIYIGMYCVRLAEAMHVDFEILLAASDGDKVKFQGRSCSTDGATKCECKRRDLYFTNISIAGGRTDKGIASWTDTRRQLVENYFELQLINYVLEKSPERYHITSYMDILRSAETSSTFVNDIVKIATSDAKVFATEEPICQLENSPLSGLRLLRHVLHEKNRSKSESSQAATTGSVNAVSQFLRGNTAQLLHAKAGTGSAFSFSPGALELLVTAIIPHEVGKLRLSDFYAEIYKRFWFTPTPDGQQELESNLSNLGLLQRFSDSGDAQFVLCEAE